MIRLRVTEWSRPDSDVFMNCPLEEGVLHYYNSSLPRAPCPWYSPRDSGSTGRGTPPYDTSAGATREASWAKVTIS